MEIFISVIHDPLFFPFVNRSCTTLGQANFRLGSITSRCSGKEPVLLPELTAGLMD